MHVVRDTHSSDINKSDIPKQNSPENSITPFLQSIPDQRDWPVEGELPIRKALDDTELAAVRESIKSKEVISGTVILTAILEQLGTMPRESDVARVDERHSLTTLIDTAESEYKKTMFKVNDRKAVVLDFDKFRTLVDMTESVESDPLFVSIMRAANFVPLKHYQREILDADRIARIMQLFSTREGDLETILQNFGVNEN